MPYRIDIASPPLDALDQLVELGALDIEAADNKLAAIIPDAVKPDRVAAALRIGTVAVSAAIARDSGSVWLLSLGEVHIGSVIIAAPEVDATPRALRLTDSLAFGTGHHPTTALCIEALEEALTDKIPDSVLDVGTGSGILALVAMMMGVPHATGLDLDPDALKIAEENSRRNNLSERLELVLGGPDVLRGSWPLVVANVLAASLIDMAPILVRRVASRGQLILSGIQCSLESEVRRAYEQRGMRHMRSQKRSGWSVVVVQASW